jgi:hypothetical protein
MKWTLLTFAATLSASVALVFGPSVAAGRVAAAAGNTTCPPTPASPVNGNLTVTTGCVLAGVTVTGNVSVIGTNGNVQICGSTIIGNLTVHQNSGGPITIGNPSACAGNTIGGNLEVHNNTSAVTVSSNKVGGNLDCHNDSPAATGSPGSNTVGGKSKGECAGLGTPGTVTVVNCPASGCSASASNSDTSAKVQVPGGGAAGTLTVTLTPPPGENSCAESVIGSLITVDPPGGYDAINPIFVHIQYVQSGLIGICKSDGEGGFFQLQTCGGGEVPVLPPCVQNLDGAAKKGSTADVEIQSGDPGILGH